MTRAPDFDVRGKDVPADLFPTGRVKFSLRIDPVEDKRGTEAMRRRMKMADLRRWQAWDILHAIQEGRLHVARAAQQVERHGEAALVTLRAELAAVPPEEPKEDPVPTLAEEVEQYTEWYAGRRGEQVHAGVVARLGVLAGGLLGPMPMNAIAEADVERAIMALVHRPTKGKRAIKPSTRESYRLTVSGLFTWSARQEAERARLNGGVPRWTVNPAAKAQVGHVAPRIVTASEDQVRALFAAAEIHQRAYLRAYLHLGFRRDELRHTRLHTDLNPDTWLWRIQPRGPDRRCRCLQCRGTGWKPKGWPRLKRAKRTLLVPELPPEGGDVLRSAIAEYLELYPAEPGDYAFRNPRTNEVWSVSSLTRDFEALCKRADVRYGTNEPGGLHLHALRHTAATNLIRSGVDSAIVAAILGDTVDTIVTNYLHLTDADLAAGIAKGPAFVPEVVHA